MLVDDLHLVLYISEFSDLEGRAESPMEHIAQGKRSDTLGSRIVESPRPERAKALRHGASIEQNIHTVFHFKTTKSAIKQG